MTIPILAIVIRVIWAIMELRYLHRYRAATDKLGDKHSAKLWDAANALECVGILISFTGVGRIPTTSNFIGISGLVLLLFGLGIRWTAINTLGRFFNGKVLIKTDHQLVRDGLYKHLRHPSYTGALIAHLGLGLAFSNWFSLGLSSAPFFIAAIYRMHVEEQALMDAFGEEYQIYSKDTKRLIPKLY